MLIGFVRTSEVLAVNTRWRSNDKVMINIALIKYATRFEEMLRDLWLIMNVISGAIDRYTRCNKIEKQDRLAAKPVSV